MFAEWGLNQSEYSSRGVPSKSKRIVVPLRATTICAQNPGRPGPDLEVQVSKYKSVESKSREISFQGERHEGRHPKGGLGGARADDGSDGHARHCQRRPLRAVTTHRTRARWGECDEAFRGQWFCVALGGASLRSRPQSGSALKRAIPEKQPHPRPRSLCRRCRAAPG